MKREEEIQEKAKELAIKYCKYLDSNGKEVYNIGCAIACCKMADWADNHPKEGLVDTKKVESWITSCFEFLNEAGNHNFKIDKFIDNFRRAVKE